MKLSTALAGAILLTTALAACKTPSENFYGNPDSYNPTPFWERDDQRDR